jgi:hypothetical protein
MSLILGKSLEAILAPHKANILADAAQSLARWTPSLEKPKAAPPALKTFAAQQAAEKLDQELQHILAIPVARVLEEQDMMEGERPRDAAGRAIWDSELAVRLEKALGADFVQPFADFQQVVSQGAEDGFLVRHLAQAYAVAVKPLPMHCGKFLAKIGIVDADIKAAEALAAKGPASNGHAQDTEDDWPMIRKPPASSSPSVAPEGAKPVSLDDLFGDASAPLNPATVGVAAPLPAAQIAASVTPPVPLPPSGKPDRDMISRAYQLWFQAGPGAEGLKAPAEALDISTGTLRNWTSGKIAAKASPAQAVWMRGDCERRIADLMEALNIFAAVRD